MISIVWQGDHRYDVYRSGQDIGCIAVSSNPYHNRHCYIKLGLDQYDPSFAGALFSLLRKELGRPLQTMLCSTEKMYSFLIAGGFQRKRRCYEIEVSSSELAAPVQASMEIHTMQKGSVLYAACCELLYAYYSATHEAVSPLTAPPDVFFANLPETVLCSLADGKPVHYAFVEPGEGGYEIAYVGTGNLPGFSSFVQTLVFELFCKCDLLTAECDDTDPAAMQLMNLFNVAVEESWDTYILE